MAMPANAAAADIEAMADDAAAFLAQLANGQRLRILCQMLEGECSVTSFVNSTGLSQPAVSHHLKKLRDSGLVETRRDAQTIYYSLKDPAIERIILALQDIFCRVPS